MPVCFTKEQHRKLEEYGKIHRMLNLSQTIEKILAKA